jgi:hypothetical protein
MVGLPLADEGIHSFLHACSIVQRVEDPSLELHSLALGEIFVLFDCLLGCQEGR